MKKLILSLISILLLSNVQWAQIQDSVKNSACLPCAELKKLKIPDVLIAQTELFNEPVQHCKVSGIIGSEINFEIALPENWNSKFFMSGNGGFAGSIQTNHAQITDGFATAGTDTGHQGHLLKADWALNDMMKQVNFGHLAVHRTAVTAKEIISQYYCSEIKYSYFLGCSRGGGQGMVEAQRYPDDFDGIIAGAPGIDFEAIAIENIQNANAVFPNPNNLKKPEITLENLNLLDSLIMIECDEIDGIKDGIINDPTECHFKLDNLPKCKNDNAESNCFTSAQLKALKIIYEGTKVGGRQISVGFPYGNESENWNWPTMITGPPTMPFLLDHPSVQFALGTEIFKYFIFNDSTWNYNSFDFVNLPANFEMVFENLNATSIDYDKFRRVGGKMIIYHGWADAGISPLETIRHYNEVAKLDPNVEDYLRLYMLPGVLHCQGGPGPNEADWLEIIQDWVENGNSPDKVVLSKTENEKITMQRPVYPFPSKATYKGTGDPNKEDNFIKSSPDK